MDLIDTPRHHWAPERKLGGGWRCFKSSPKAPAAPDPVQTANAQTASNTATANAQATLNHSNQYTPWGSQTWAQGTPDASGTSQWTSTIKLDPDQQKLLDSSNQISQMLANLGIQQAGQVGNSLSNPLDYSKLPQVNNTTASGSVNTAGIPAFQTGANYGKIQNSVNGAGIQNQVAGGGDIQSQIAGAGKIQNGVNMSGVSSLVGGDALSGAMKDNQQAAYKQQSAYLDSSYGQRQKDLENQLIQQGVTQNSDAWNRAMNNLGEQRTFDYNNAYNNSFATGLAANKQLYDQGLSTNQTQYGQALNNGQFANQAQGQQFGQNQAQQQANNSAQLQQFNQNLAQGQFANSAAAQQFAQNLAQGQFANQAQSQGFGQAANNVDRNNSVASNMFSQGLASAQLGNQASAQNFSQSSAARQQALQEMLQQQQNPINILNALRSGSQVTSPQFGSTPQGNVANTDIAGLYNNQYQGQLAGFNSQVAQNNSLTSGLFGLGSAYLLSDRRLKTNVHRVGTHALGIGLYTYDYIWGEPGAGVMADELEQVMPEAVAVHPSGFKMVNYGVL